MNRRKDKSDFYIHPRLGIRSPLPTNTDNFNIACIRVSPALAHGIVHGVRTTKGRTLRVRQIPVRAREMPKAASPWSSQDPLSGLALIVASSSAGSPLEEDVRIWGTERPNNDALKKGGVIGIARVRNTDHDSLIVSNAAPLPFVHFSVDKKISLASFHRNLSPATFDAVIEYAKAIHEDEPVFGEHRTASGRVLPIVMVNRLEHDEFPLTEDGAAYINFSERFTPNPGARYRREHEREGYSGEEFRDNILLPALATGRTVIVDLCGLFGMAASFQCEAFAGAIRGCETLDEAFRMFDSIKFRCGRGMEDDVENIRGMMEDEINELRRRDLDLSPHHKTLEDALFS
jgi:hypothetical protein